MKIVNKNLQFKRLTRIGQRALGYLPGRAQAAAWLALGLFTFLTGAALLSRAPLVASPVTAYYTAHNATELSAEDRGLYLMIERAQASGDYAKADALIGKLVNRGLLGYVLAERYLNPAYSASTQELEAWLTYYSDQPQAERIAGMALARGISVSLPQTPDALKGNGSSDHLGRSSMPDSWFTALDHWRAGRFVQAAQAFSKASAMSSLNDWQRAEAHYWAYRTYARLESRSQANAHLRQAAAYPNTFYGLLASQRLGIALPAAQAPKVSEALRRNPRAIRASLLAQLERKDEAETELRALYSAVAEGKRTGIVTLASELNLANLQMRLARTPGLSKSEIVFARFPMPHYIVSLDEIVDPALVMAVARNESAFHEEAHNRSSGAMGLMQMLPSTARAVERRVGETLLSDASASESSGGVAMRLSNPSLSARYGAEYLRILSKEKAIDNSLIHLLIGYNAGPGTVASWRAAAHDISDPLLFIESIPYAETRNYVMQVLAQYWIYQASMDAPTTSLSALSQDQWPVLQASR